MKFEKEEPEKNFKPVEEWFKQAEYDLETAKAMFSTDRFIYTVFMCHLTIEKALKGLYTKKFKSNAPKTHDLIYLVKKIELELLPSYRDFLETLNDLSVPTRYPDDLERLLNQYRREKTEEILLKTEELFLWIRGNL
ncbi:MAG TPA: HEPN domain-containing protein [bacterium]|nr:HEPN domain-containing protein [bacterium]HPC77107.1 HEPN domain-containing protein [bacterium]HRR92199.1 HEPN domain-containing protein [bacterium]HRU32415.1 HEPN domain-containing protein [bacterium]